MEVKNYLQLIETESPSQERLVAWLSDWPDMAPSRAHGIFSQSRDMGLYQETDRGCVLTVQGQTFLENGDATMALTLLQERIAFFDELLPKVLEDQQAESEMSSVSNQLVIYASL